MEYTASAFWRQGRVGLRDVAFVVVATIKKRTVGQVESEHTKISRSIRALI